MDGISKMVGLEVGLMYYHVTEMVLGAFLRVSRSMELDVDTFFVLFVLGKIRWER